MVSWRLIGGVALGVIGSSAVVRGIAACLVLEELGCGGESGPMSDVSLCREGGAGMELVGQDVHESGVLQVGEDQNDGDWQ